MKVLMEVKKMAIVNAADVITKFYTALNDNWGYIYGKAGEKWTQEK